MKSAKNILNDIFAYNVTFVEMFESYVKQFVDVYQKNQKCSKMLAFKIKKEFDAKKKKIEKMFVIYFFHNKSHVFDAKKFEKSKICNDSFE